MRKLRKVIPFGLAVMMSVSGVYPSTGVLAAQQQISTNSEIKKKSDTSDQEDTKIHRYLSPKNGFHATKTKNKSSATKKSTLKTAADPEAKEGEIGYKFTQDQTINDAQKVRYEYTIIANGEVELDCVSRVTADEITFPSTVSLNGVIYKVTSAYIGFELGSHIKHLIIPEGIEIITYGGTMTNEIVTIPSTLKEIKQAFHYSDDEWFDGSNRWKEQQTFKKFEMSNQEEAKYFMVQDGILYNKDQTKLAAPVPPQLEMDELTLPDTLQEIPDAAFEFTKIKKVVCGKNITSIGEGAFAGSDIEDIEMNDKITSIGQFALAYCKKLKHVELSAGVTKLLGYTFYETESLKHLDLKHVTSLNGTGTIACSGLEDIDISNIDDLTGDQPFTGCDNLKTVYIGKNTDFTGNSGLGVNPFAGCHRLEKYIEKEKNEHYLYVENGKLYASQMVGKMRNLNNTGYDDMYITKWYHGKILVGYPFVQMVEDAKKNNGCLKIPEGITQLAKGANLEGSSRKAGTNAHTDVNNIDVYFTKLIIPASVEAVDLIMTSPGANLEIDFYGDTFPLINEGLCSEYMSHASDKNAVLGTKTFKFKSKDLYDKFNSKWKSKFLGLYENEKVVCDVLPEKKTTSLTINQKDEVLKCVGKSYKMKVLATLSSDDCTDFVKLNSSNEEVATVDAYRNISTKIGAHGTSTITVTAGDYSQSFDVTVAGDMEVDSTATEDKTYVYDKDEYDSDDKFLKTIKDDISASCKDCGTKLTEGKDYEITISDYKKTGKATVTIKGIEGFEGFEDSFKVNVNYMPKKILVKKYNGNGSISGLEENSSLGTYKWTGKDVKPDLDDIHIENKSGFDLTEGTDYKIEYPDGMISDGEKTVKIIGINDYEGTVLTYHYTIEKQHGWNGFTVKGHKDGDDLGEFDWTGGRIEPELEVTCNHCGDPLNRGTDYYLEYTNEHSDPGKVTVKVIGLNDYEGWTQSFTYTIKNKTFTFADHENGRDLGELEYNGEEVKYRIYAWEINDRNYNRLTKDVDYKVTYSNNDKPGKATMNIIGLGEYEGCNLSFTYTLVDYDGQSGFYGGSYADQSNIGSFYYTGEEIKPEMFVYSRYSRTLLIDGKDYKIEYKNNIECGTASMKVIGINRFAGHELNFTYTIKNKTFTFADHENGSDLGEVEYDGEEVKYPIYSWEIIDQNYNTLTENVDYKVTYSNNDKPGKATMNIIGLGEYEGCNLSFTYILVDYDGESGFDGYYNGYRTDQSNIGSFYYTGKEIKPDMSLLSNYHRTQLTEGKDYKIEYKNNIDCGTASMKVIGINRYAGHELNFIYTIKKKTFTFAGHENGSDLGTKECTGSEVKYWVGPSEIKNDEGIPLTENVDYKIVYSNNINPGTATMNIIGLGDYEGCNLSFTYTISNKAFMYNGYGTNNDHVNLGTVAYTGKATEYKIHRVYEKYNFDQELTEGRDYKLVYSNNTKPGTAKVEIIGLGDYEGCNLTFTYTIVDYDAQGGFSSNLYTDKSNIGSFAYTGEEVRPSLGLIYGNYSQSFLIEGTDYKIEYSNNVNPGTATAKVIGINRFAGKELIFTYTIKNKSFASKDHKDGENLGTLKWTGKEQTIDVGSFYDATDGHTLVENKDYKLVYSDNKDAGTAKVRVIGLGYYDGSELSFTYTIEKQHGWNGFYVKGHKDGDSLGTYKWTGNSILIDPDMRCSHCDKELEENKDYKVEYTNNIDPGTATMKITGLGDYKGYELTFTFVIEKKTPSTTEDQKPTTTTTTTESTTTTTEKKDPTTEGTTTTTTETKPTTTTTEATTTTTETRPTTSTTETTTETTTESSSTTTETSPVTTTEQKVTTTAVKRTEAPKISLKKAIIHKIKAAKKAATVMIRKNEAVKDYEISYSYKKNFKGGKIKDFKKLKYKTMKVKKKKYSVASYKLKGLKRKKTVYIKVRSYKMSGNAKVYGKWSSVKKVKIK